jgi:hypothetical protein
LRYTCSIGGRRKRRLKRRNSENKRTKYGRIIRGRYRRYLKGRSERGLNRLRTCIECSNRG